MLQIRFPNDIITAVVFQRFKFFHRKWAGNLSCQITVVRPVRPFPGDWWLPSESMYHPPGWGQKTICKPPIFQYFPKEMRVLDTMWRIMAETRKFESWKKHATDIPSSYVLGAHHFAKHPRHSKIWFPQIIFVIFSMACNQKTAGEIIFGGPS